MEKEWALITGASSGIGYAYAKELAGRGYSLVIVSNEEEAIREKGKLLEEQFGVEVWALCRDLAVEGAAKELYEACRTKQIPVSVLINNAGMYHFSEMLDATTSFTEKTLFLHIYTPTLLCHYFGRDMRERRYGYILNMSSMTAWLPFPGIVLYGSTKRYLKNFTRALHTELYDYNVYVTAICPGAVATNLYNLSEKMKRMGIATGIMMTPEKLAARGVKALFHRRAVVMPGFFNHLFVPFMQLLPHTLIRILMRKVNILPLQK